jgi:hypothetical protein
MIPVDDVPHRRQSLLELVQERANARTNKKEARRAAEEDGWERIMLEEKATKVTYQAPRVDDAYVEPHLTLGQGATLMDLLLAVFPIEMMEEWLNDLKESHPNVSQYISTFGFNADNVC